MPSKTPPAYTSLQGASSQRYLNSSQSPSEQAYNRRIHSDSFNERPARKRLSALRDTTVNIATAFTQAARQGRPTAVQSPSRPPLSPIRSDISTLFKSTQPGSFNLYPNLDNLNDTTEQPSMQRRIPSSLSYREDDPLSTILDSYTNNSNNNSKLHRKLSVTDAELKSNPFAEEELLFKYPEEEFRRRTEVESRESTPRKSRSRSGTPAFETLDEWRKRIDGVSPLRRSMSREAESIHSESTDSIVNVRRQTFLWQPLQRVLDSMFRWIMFWIFMIFWTIKEAVVTALGLTLKLLDFVIATPVIMLLTRLQKMFHFITGKNLMDEELLKKATQPPTSQLRRLTRIAPILFIFVAIGSMLRNAEITSDLKIPSTESIKLALSSVPPTVARLTAAFQRQPEPALPKSMEELASRIVSVEKYTLVLAETAQKLRQNENRLETLERSDALKLTKLGERLSEAEMVIKKLTHDTGNTISTELTKHKVDLEKAIAAALDKDQRIEGVQSTVADLRDRLQSLTSLETAIHTLEKKFTDLKLDSHQLDEFTKISEQLNDQLSRDEAHALVQHQLSEFKSDMMKSFKSAAKADLRPDAMDIVNRMIDEAILKYHQDYLALPDYALASSGARIIPRLTSPTYELEPTDNLKWLIHKVIPFRDTSPAITALYPDTNVGQCWPMVGNNGSIGILLSQPIKVTGVTIEHAGKQVLLDRRSAPKNFALWGVYGEHLGQTADGALGDQSQHVIELTSGQYDAEDPNAVQSFPVSPQKPTRVVVIRVKDNWGHPDYTCLYRIRIHGEPI
ncbi:hypothetical protein INT44_000655 [Umbelopsis vinacea]|uniref:SUN domain-containing protein n=1 Tax=Umbelopsis vinacea TaxID=44442 RepID=A0A8H7Q9P9_9FUNG|nr:hypothetical protein INT44_000655 [Umbelopsis vinacea]